MVSIAIGEGSTAAKHWMASLCAAVFVAAYCVPAHAFGGGALGAVVTTAVAADGVQAATTAADDDDD